MVLSSLAAPSYPWDHGWSFWAGRHGSAASLLETDQDLKLISPREKTTDKRDAYLRHRSISPIQGIFEFPSLGRRGATPAPTVTLSQ